MGDALGMAADLRVDVALSSIELNGYELARVLDADPEELVYALPVGEFRTDRESSPKERAETIRLFADGGMKISVSQIRREYRLDTPTSDDDVLPGKPVTVTSGGAVSSTTDASDGFVNPKVHNAPAPDGPQR